MNRLQIYLCVIFSILLCLSGCVNNQPQAIDKKGETSKTSSANENVLSVESSDSAATNEIDSADGTSVTPEPLPYPSSSLWPIIIKHYKLSQRTPVSILKNDIDWLKRNKKFLSQAPEYSRRYLYYITSELDRRNMPGELALLPMIESNYKATSRAPGGFEGLWQFSRATGLRMGLEYNWWYNGSFDVVASTDAALDYMEKLAKHYDGDWLLAMAAYNCGSGTLDKIISKNRKINPHTDFWRLPLPDHTRNHLQRLFALTHVMAHPKRYGIEPIAIENRQYFSEIILDKPIDMTVLAHASGTSLSEIQLLNPGFLRSTTDPLKKRRVLIPVNNSADIQQKIARIPEEQRFTWPRYQTTGNDSLNKIAQRYGISVAVLQQMNGLGSKSRISANRELFVPSSKMKVADAEENTSRKSAKRTNANSAYHQVSSGDNLWSIARRYRITVAELLEWNQLKKNQVLKVGQKLRIKN
jgi:membrane-bound lytic murein transglycosylase D